MAIALYIKKEPHVKTQRNTKYDRFFFAAITTLGIFSMIFALGPLLAWQIKTLPALSAKINFQPVPDKQVLSATTTAGKSIEVIKDSDGFSYFTTDFKPQGKRPKDFLVSIPKLEIKAALVVVDSLKFEKSLSHFPGTALPGEVGNAFITGHSVLPQFNDPQNYRAIFTNLSKLEIGDSIEVEVEGNKFSYMVQYSKIVDPHDVSVLFPISPNAKNLTLMSCVPPGTSSKRIIVVTSLL